MRRHWLSITAALGMLGAFAAGYWTAAGKPTVYESPLNGFRIEAPEFEPVPGGTTQVVLHMFGPASDGFAPNLNVMVQPAMTAQQLRDISSTQFVQIGLKVLREEPGKLQGRDTVLYEYAGQMQQRDMHFLALGVCHADRTYLVTCTSLESQFAKLKAAFEAAVKSFKLLDAPR